MDDAVASRLRELTGSEVAFVAGGRVLASSLPAETCGRPAKRWTSGGPFNVQLGEEEFLALARPMPGGTPSCPASAGPAVRETPNR